MDRPGGESVGQEDAFPSFLGKAAAASRELVARVEHEIQLLQELAANARREEELINGLLAMRQGQPRAGGVSDDADLSARVRHEGTSDKAMIPAVIDIIGTAGRPVHISDLVRILREREVPIPGSGTQANVISHIRRSPEIVRTSRGMYALASFGIAQAPAKTRTKRKRRRRTSTKRS